MADVDEILDGSRHDLTPEGDSAAGTESVPAGGPDTAPVLAGDYRDDDGTYIDQEFEQNPDLDDFSPTIEAPQFQDVTSLGTVTDTMIPQGAIMQPADPPFMLFPADARRETLLIRCIDATDGTTNQPFQIASDKNQVYGSPVSVPNLYTADGLIRLRGYTGPLWIAVQNATHPVRVAGWSIGK